MNIKLLKYSATGLEKKNKRAPMAVNTNVWDSAILNPMIINFALLLLPVSK